MKKIIFLLLPAVLLLFINSASAGLWGQSVSFEDLNDQRTFSVSDYDPPYSEGGLSGYWPYSFKIQWNISYDFDSMLWSYQYTLSATRKDISHFILELTDGVTQENFMDIHINGKRASFGEIIQGPDYWGLQAGNPGYPGDDIYGIKFKGDGHTVTYSFASNLDPVWGNFYVRSGKDEGKWIYAYNNALGKEGFDSYDKLDFIVRPNGGTNPPVVPEPVSSVLFIAGGSLLGIRRFLKRKS